MNKKISAEEFRGALDRHASDLKANLLLAQGIIASEAEGEGKVKRTWRKSLVLALAMILTLGTVAYGVTSIYRTVNWKGETEADVQEPVLVEGDPQVAGALVELGREMADKPENEFVTAWYDDGTGKNELDVLNTEAYPAKKVFRNVEDFLDYMSGVETLTAPSWFPEGEYESFLAEVSFACRASGNYELIESGKAGPICYNRFRLAEEDAVPYEYLVNITMRHGNGYVIQSTLWPEEGEAATVLSGEETAQAVTVKGMEDAVLFPDRASTADMDLAMRRALKNPVTLKRPYYRDAPQEDDVKEFTDEHIYIWKGGDKDLEDVLKLFAGE
ncbi:MAG: hypothetical protein IJK71_03340 [Clostridia bacterium]|nr:hypothetical protein [Clostridia bacterium]